MPQQIREIAGDIRALDFAVKVDDQRAVAVVDLKAAVRTTAHGSCCNSRQHQKAAFAPGVLETALKLGVQLRFFGGRASGLA